MSSIIRGFTTACVGLLACAAFATSAAAQVTELAIAADKDWAHQWTSMEFPAEIDGFERESVSQFEERQTNVSARYWDAETSTILSLYIYRPGNPDVAVWFDRALIAIGVVEEYGSVDLDRMKIGTFAPNGSEVESGQYAVLEVDGTIRSTAVALFRSGEWLVKVRISSQELSVTQMDEMLKQTLIVLPTMEEHDSNAAYFVSQCSNTLEFGSAEAMAADMAIALEMAISVAADALPDEEKVGDSETNEANGPSAYCREGDRNRQFNVFRPNESQEEFYIALGDGGFGIEVFPDSVATLLSEEESDQPIYAVRSATGLVAEIHTPFRGMPNLQQVSQSALNGPVLASVSRALADDDDRQININSDLLEE